MTVESEVTPPVEAPEAPKAPETVNPPTDLHKDFFNDYVAKEEAKVETMKAKLDTKLTEQEKFYLERDIFNAEKELARIGVQPKTPENLIGEVEALGIKPGTESYDFVKETISTLSGEEAKSVLSFLNAYEKARWAKAPIDLAGGPQWDPRTVSKIGYSTEDLLNKDTSSQAKANLLKLLTGFKE